MSQSELVPITSGPTPRVASISAPPGWITVTRTLGSCTESRRMAVSVGSGPVFASWGDVGDIAFRLGEAEWGLGPPAAPTRRLYRTAVGRSSRRVRQRGRRGAVPHGRAATRLTQHGRPPAARGCYDGRLSMGRRARAWRRLVWLVPAMHAACSAPVRAEPG